MFETIGTLITIVFWAIAIFLFGGGLFLCGMNLFTGNGWQKFWAVVAIILGVIAFSKLYAWLDSVVWCLILTGIVLGVIGNLGANEPQEATTKTPKEPGVIEKLADQAIKDQRDIAIVEEAIRRSKE